MEKLAKNKVVLVVVVIIVGVGLVAAYIPLLFVPSVYEEQPQPETENQDTEPIVEASSTPVVPTATSSEQTSDPFSGIGDEQESLDDLGNLLNQ